jgi:hypothetical protein
VRPRTLLVLLLVVVGLLVFISLYERELPSSDERAAQANRLFRFDSEEVDSLEIEWEGNRVVLERQAGEEAENDAAEATGGPGTDEWRLTKPLAARADATLVESLVGAMTSMEKDRTLADMTAAEAGLDKPRARVKVHLGNEVRELLVGSEVPASSTMIVGVEGKEEFFVVADGIWSELTRKPGDWRSREVLAAQRADIERISLSAGGERLLLARRGDDFWLESPVVDRADEAQVTKLIGDLTSLRVESFVDEPERAEGEMGLTRPRGVLEVVLKDQAEPFRLELGAAVPDTERRFMARVEGQLIELDTGLAEAIDRPVAEWRSSAWSSMETFEIDEVVVEDGAGAMTLVRADANWRRGDDEIPFTTASDLLYAITEAEADRVLSAAEAESLGADWQDPLLEIRLAGDDESEGDELTLFATDEGDYLGRSADRDSVLVIPAEAVEEIRSKIAEVRSAETLPEEMDPETKATAGDQG